MEYRYSTSIEEIGFQSNDTPEIMSYIVTKRGFDLLEVTCSWDADAEFLFALKNDDDYDLVRGSVMDTIARCEKMEEVIDLLCDAFQSRFADILVT